MHRGTRSYPGVLQPAYPNGVGAQDACQQRVETHDQHGMVADLQSMHEYACKLVGEQPAFPSSDSFPSCDKENIPAAAELRAGMRKAAQPPTRLSRCSGAHSRPPAQPEQAEKQPPTLLPILVREQHREYHVFWKDWQPYNQEHASLPDAHHCGSLLDEDVSLLPPAVTATAYRVPMVSVTGAPWTPPITDWLAAPCPEEDSMSQPDSPTDQPSPGSCDAADAVHLYSPTLEQEMAECGPMLFSLHSLEQSLEVCQSELTLISHCIPRAKALLLEGRGLPRSSSGVITASSAMPAAFQQLETAADVALEGVCGVLAMVGRLHAQLQHLQATGMLMAPEDVRTSHPLQVLGSTDGQPQQPTRNMLCHSNEQLAAWTSESSSNPLSFAVATMETARQLADDALVALHAAVSWNSSRAGIDWSDSQQLQQVLCSVQQLKHEYSVQVARPVEAAAQGFRALKAGCK